MTGSSLSHEDSLIKVPQRYRGPQFTATVIGNQETG